MQSTPQFMQRLWLQVLVAYSAQLDQLQGLQHAVNTVVDLAEHEHTDEKGDAWRVGKRQQGRLTSEDVTLAKKKETTMSQMTSLQKALKA